MMTPSTSLAPSLLLHDYGTDPNTTIGINLNFTFSCQCWGGAAGGTRGLQEVLELLVGTVVSEYSQDLLKLTHKEFYLFQKFLSIMVLRCKKITDLVLK